MSMPDGGFSWAALWDIANTPDEPPEPVNAPAGSGSATAPAGAPAVTAVKPRCTAHNARTGKPCKNAPIHGGTVCIAHGGKAPQVKEKAAARYQEQQAAELARKSVGNVDLSRFSDPFEALEFAIG